MVEKIVNYGTGTNSVAAGILSDLQTTSSVTVHALIRAYLHQ